MSATFRLAAVATILGSTVIVWSAEPAPDYRAEAEAFVAKCLKDPNVYVFNPPVDADPYPDLVGHARVVKMGEVLQGGGSVLMLYVDGMPAALNSEPFSRALPQAPKPGEAPKPRTRKQWYPDGRPMMVEEYLGEDLVSGVYYDAKGGVLGRVEKGKGTAFELNVMMPGAAMGGPGTILATCEYANGKRNGQLIRWLDYAKKLKSMQEEYKDGKKTGLAIRWQPTGQVATIATFENGIPGDEVSFKPDGSVAGASRYKDGYPVPLPAEEAAKYDPKPYKQAEWTPTQTPYPEVSRHPWPAADEVPGPSGAVLIGRVEKDILGVKPKTGEVVLSADEGKTWKSIKADLGFTPCEIVLTSDGGIFIWGVLPTETPLKGLPNRIVYSLDRGATWKTTSAPVDYLTAMEGRAGNMIAFGKNLPPGGLKAGEDWFPLHDWVIVTTVSAAGTGKRWTKTDIPMQGFDNLIVKTVQREGTEARLYVIKDPGWLDPSSTCTVIYHGSLKDVPREVARCAKQPEVSFGADGNTAEIREPGEAPKTADLRVAPPRMSVGAPKAPISVPTMPGPGGFPMDIPKPAEPKPAIKPGK